MSELPICFICFEPTSQLCHCACVGRYAHIECLFRFHAGRRCIKCTVCKTPIGGMRIERKTRTRPSTNSYLLVSGCVAFCTLLPVAVLLTMRSVVCDNIALAISLLLFAVAALGLIFCLRGLFCWRVRHHSLVVRRVAVRVVAQIVNAPEATASEEMDGVELAPV